MTWGGSRGPVKGLTSPVKEGAGAPAMADRKVYRGSSGFVVARAARADSGVPSKFARKLAREGSVGSIEAESPGGPEDEDDCGKGKTGMRDGTSRRVARLRGSLHPRATAECGETRSCCLAFLTDSMVSARVLSTAERFDCSLSIIAEEELVVMVAELLLAAVVEVAATAVLACGAATELSCWPDDDDGTRPSNSGLNKNWKGSELL